MNINLNPDSIRRADDASHFDAGAVRAREAQRVYESLLPMFEPKPEHTGEQREYLERRSLEWKALVEKAYSDIIARRASWVPVMVAGPSNYPAERMGKRADGEMRAAEEWREKMERFEANTRKALSAMEPGGQVVERYRKGCSDPIPSDDPLAVEKLSARLEHLTETQARMKRMNAWFRKHGTCVGFEDMREDEARRYDAQIAGGYSWERQPYPAWALSNNNANIKRIQVRLEEARRTREAMEKQPPEAEVAKGDGFRVVQNAEACRVQILFDEKPDERVRVMLKARGFRWAPSAGAWQRLLNQNGIRAARQVAKDLGGM